VVVYSKMWCCNPYRCVVLWTEASFSTLGGDEYFVTSENARTDLVQ